MDEIQNWYEKIVYTIIYEQRSNPENSTLTTQDLTLDTELWSDVACLALNHLPPRYVRHSVDMTFYLSPQERLEMEQRAESAVQDALDYVRSHSAIQGQKNKIKSA